MFNLISASPLPSPARLPISSGIQLLQAHVLRDLGEFPRGQSCERLPNCITNILIIILVIRTVWACVKLPKFLFSFPTPTLLMWVSRE